jgi:hypothetical protein
MSAATNAAFLSDVIGGDGMVRTDRLAVLLRITKGELASAFGLSRDAVSKTGRLKAQATQTRLREATQIINRVLPWSGSAQLAFAWYRSQPLPAFGDQTAEELVREGRADHVMSYLSGLALGGYA